MDKFCGSKYWDLNKTWLSETPDFTYCFQETALTWLPCAFLCLLLPYEIYQIKTNKIKTHLPWTLYNWIKIITTLALVVLSLIDLAYGLWLAFGSHAFPVSYYTPFIKLITFILVLALLWYQRINGVHTSPILFIFWLIQSIVGLINYRSIFLMIYSDNEYNGSQYNIPLYTKLVFGPIMLFQLFMSCFADRMPDEYKRIDSKTSPQESASFLSQLTLWWCNSLILLGYKKPLTKEDMWSLNDRNKTEQNVKRLTKTINSNKKSGKIGDNNNESIKKSEKQKQYHGVLVPLIKTYWITLVHLALLKLCCSVIIFVNPIILNLLISFMSNDEPHWRGYLYGAIMFFSSMLESLIVSQYEIRIQILGMNIRSCITNFIYQKSLRLSSTGRNRFTIGEIVNLMSIDANRFMEFVVVLNDLWSTPIQITIAIYLLWNQLGIASIAGIIVMILLIPINAFVSGKMRYIHLQVMKFKDKRIKLMNEILNGIKVLKLYAWEKSFNNQIDQLRNNEVNKLKKRSYLQGIMVFAFQSSSILIAIACFTTYALIDKENKFNANIAFVSLTLLNQIRQPFAVFPRIIVFFVLFRVSLKRINDYLNGDELSEDDISHDPNMKDPIVVKNASFAWINGQQPVLKNVSFRVRQKQLIAIVGQIGSGKSSLLNALLGNMSKIKGEVNIVGTTAYVPQQAWIMSATLKNNIIYTNPFVKERLDKTIDCCELTSDLDILPGRELTEIGEKGINLSGGQKQRVSMARACYSDADIYLLDDPLSALDAHVGKQVFEKVISSNGILKDKTRVLVTHRISVLPKCDQIIVIKDGVISECGSYNELLTSKGAFAEFLISHLAEEGVDDDIDTEMLEEIASNIKKVDRQLSKQTDESIKKRTQSVASTNSQKSAKENNPKDLDKKKAKLIEAEKSEVGSVKLKVYIEYMKKVGIEKCLIVLLCMTMMSGFNIGSGLWLTQWSQDSKDESSKNDTALRHLRLGVYAALGLGEAFFLLITTVVLSIATLLGSRLLHIEMLANILRAPMSYFDTTPMGRILNRFSRDIDVCDTMLQMNIRITTINLFRTLVSFIVIGIQTPWMLIAVPPLSVIYYFIQHYYIPTSRQLKRIESTSRSPIYIHFSETLSGTTSIRAYGSVGKFIDENNKRVDVNNSCFYPSLVTGRWLSTRLEFLGYTIVLCCAMIAVASRGTTSAGTVGLTLSYALTITKSLNMLVRELTNLETNIVSVERCLEYTRTPNEAPWFKQDSVPAIYWPEKGQINFENYSTRYRPGLDLVLKQLKFSINPGERVGVVGRTGAGKSSLTLALFRIVEPADGTIIVDNTDITKLGLYDLRSRLTIIPQDPVLFTGTLRLNLDPFDVHSDEQIWYSLELAHLKPFVSQLKSGLSHEISEGGDNLSVGQKQLVCLARALLRNSRIIVLDEATAAVDIETDELIQKTIREQFASCTIITIAHRLNTVIDYDKILVLNQGQLAEYDSPNNLIQNTNSIFHSMAKDAGLI